MVDISEFVIIIIPNLEYNSYEYIKSIIDSYPNK